MADHVADKPLSVPAVIRIVRIHVLPHAITDRRPAKRPCNHLRMRLPHPGGNRIGGRPHDDLDAGLAHSVNDPVHPGIVKFAIGRLPKTPRGLAHADDTNACFLHERGIFFKSSGLQFVRHVLVVVRRTIQHIGHQSTWWRSPLLRQQDRGHTYECRSNSTAECHPHLSSSPASEGTTGKIWRCFLLAMG